jgi:uncharacterized DUF497 family protein
MEFEWDSDNLSHIARHGMTPADVEALLDHPDTEFTAPYTRGGQWHVMATGPRFDGRIVVVVFTQRGGMTRVVTAYPASPRTERTYREGHR